MNLFEAFAKTIMDSLAADSHTSQTTEPVAEEPERMRKGKRAANRCPPPPLPQHTEYDDLDDSRQAIFDEMLQYIEEPDPDYMLLVKSKAGTGKTTALVRLMHWVVANRGERALYSGPRHDFFLDILKTCVEINEIPAAWYEWLARQWNMDDPLLNTCRYSHTIGDFNDKGYESDHFCRRACGTAYMKMSCRYLAQKRITNPLIFIQHQHIVSGHPLAEKCSLLVGDENPMSVFVRELTIPASKMQWSQLDLTGEMAQIMHHFAQIAASEAKLSGVKLYLELGVQDVIDACQEYMQDYADHVVIPKIDPIGNLQNQIDNMPYNILPTLVPLLLREAQATLSQLNRNGSYSKSDFIERVALDGGKLTLLTRNHLSDKMPKHIIWADATGDPVLYEQEFGRKVKVVEPILPIKGQIFQGIDRSNNKTSLIRQSDADLEDRAQTEISYTEQAQQLRLLVEYINAQNGYTNNVVITPKSLSEFMDADTHFYANRGTNSFKDCQAITIAGTPAAPRQELERLAACLWYDRMDKFDNTWVIKDTPYNYIDPNDGQGWSLPVGHYADPQLDALLWQTREAEIIQSVHRARILFRDVPVYLLTNLPIADLPPTQIFTYRQMLNAPEGVPIFKWQSVLDFARSLDEQYGGVSLTQLIDGLGINKETATKYMNILKEKYGWVDVPFITQNRNRGRPPRRMTAPRQEEE